MGNKICAGIVTYNPDIDRLIKSINSICNQVEMIYLCDNGSSNISIIKTLSERYNLSIIVNDNNGGIAKALNQLCSYAFDNGFNWILTLDQDSVCNPYLVNRLSRFCDNSIAIIGPRIIYEDNEQYSAKKTQVIEKADWIITSGSLTNLNIWKQLDGFDEWMFIDLVDTDYGIRANRAGYSIIRVNEAEIYHELGDLKCKRLFGRIVYVTNHSAFRIFYQSRNSVYLFKKLKYGNPFINILKIIFKILFFENRKFEKLKSVFKGIHSGIKQRVVK